MWTSVLNFLKNAAFVAGAADTLIEAWDAVASWIYTDSGDANDMQREMIAVAVENTAMADAMLAKNTEAIGFFQALYRRDMISKQMYYTAVLQYLARINRLPAFYNPDAEEAFSKAFPFSLEPVYNSPVMRNAVRGAVITALDNKGITNLF